MSLLSAYEDFCTRTLSALHGAWRRLQFVSGLKGEKGKYEHWGMAYTHGPVQANRAIAQAHTELFQRVLETPIPTLNGELEEVGPEGPGQAAPDQFVPEDRNGCSKEHFRYVSTALHLLAELRSNRRAS